MSRRRRRLSPRMSHDYAPPAPGVKTLAEALAYYDGEMASRLGGFDYDVHGTRLAELLALAGFLIVPAPPKRRKQSSS